MDDPKRIYLIHDRRDCGEADDVAGCLFDQGFEVVTPLFEGKPDDVQQDHKDNLVYSDGVLIFYGRANEPWLRHKLLDLRKAPGYGRPKNRGFRAKAVYLAPPSNEAKGRFRTHEASVIDGFGGFSPDLLTPFVLQLAG